MFKANYFFASSLGSSPPVVFSTPGRCQVHSCLYNCCSLSFQPHFLGLLLSPTRAASGCLWNFQIQSERHEQDPGLSDEALPAEVPGFHLFLPLKSAVVSSEGVGAAVHLVSQGWNEMRFSRLEGREKPLAPVSSKWHALQVHGAGAPRGTD